MTGSQPEETQRDLRLGIVAELEAAELISFVRERLASYKQPRVVLFVAQIPRSASGKVLRRMLKEVYEPPSETIT
jgi:acyl-coenzyme A synthetase/AMP-(fatty) acid ligase